MATSVDEQSEKLLDSNVTDEISSQKEKQNISAQETLVLDTNQESDNKHMVDNEQPMTSEFHHHAVEDGVPSESAFHVVTRTDDHRDGSMMEQSNSEVGDRGQTDIISQDCASSRSDDEQDKQACEKGSKIFAAHTVDQQAKSCEDASEDVASVSQQLQTVDSVAQDENALSEIPLSENKTSVEGMCKDDAEAITSEFHTSYEDDSFRKIDSELLNEDSKVSQKEDSKTITDFQFLKPTVMETVGKDASVVSSSVDNDVENELGRHLGTVHKPEEVLNIDEETRMGLDQTPVDPSMIEASFIYPTLPPKKLFQLDDTKDSEASDTETKMSAACDSEDIRLRNTISIDDATKDSAASDSNLETPTPSRKQRRASRDGLGISMMEGLEAGERVFTAENLFEYQWPQDGGEWCLLQEQVSEYLKIKSFKRKYPDLYRRTCDKEEKDFLRDKGVVTETQSDLGLTALRSEEVYDLMMKDYNSKYKDYISHLQEKQKKVIREKHKEYSSQAKLDKSKIDAYSKKAARSAAEFNNSLMRDRKEERRAYFDLQTYTIHYPKNKFKTMPAQYTKVGAYPVALLPGQYQENYKKYSAEELKYYPLKTSLKDPPKVVKYIRPPPAGVKLPATVKHKSMVTSDVDDSGCSSREDNEDDIENIDNENDDKENETGQVEGSDIISLVRLEKKAKAKRKYTKMSSPDRLKKVGKKMKDAEADKDDEKVNPDGTEKGTSPDAKNKMPAKIHGLEKCRICKTRSTKEERKAGKLVKCAECGKIGHMGCLDLTDELVAVIKTYPWQCMECKTCVECLDPYDEDKMMFCDRCDRGYHTFCIGLDALPTGHWECKSCEGLPPISDKPKLNLSQGSQPVRSKKVSQASAMRSSLSVKSEPELGEDESGSLKSEGQTATDSPDKQMRVSSLSEGKETTGSEKEGKSNATVGVQATGERRGRKKGSLMSPKSRTKSPKPRPSKKDKIKKARQSRRLKKKEGGKNSEENKILKRKRRSKKMEEREENRVVGKAEEIESGEYKMERIGGSRSHLDEFREFVGEGVDDSFVSVYDKDEHKGLGLMHSVSRNIGAQHSGSMEVNLKDNMDTSALKLDEMASLGVSKAALKADHFSELEYTSEKDKIEQAFSLLPAETTEILQCEAMDQTTNNLVCAVGNAATLSVYGELHDTGYVSLAHAQQPDAVDQYQALTVTAGTYSASNEGFHSQLSNSQIQFHTVPQVTSSSLPVEDLRDLQLPVSQSHVLLTRMPPQPGTLLPEIAHLESQNAPYHGAPSEMPQENLCLQDVQLQAMLPSVSLASDQSALFSLPSADVNLSVQHVEDVPQVEPALLDPTHQSSFVCMDAPVGSLTSSHPAADIASPSVDSTTRMDVHEGLSTEKIDNSANENLTNL